MKLQQEISILYFKYDVVTRVVTEIPSRVQMPALSACFRYSDVIDYERINSVKGTGYKLTLDPRSIRQLQHEITVLEIFNFTPDVLNILQACRTRHPNSYALDERYGKGCNQLFNISKFFALEYVCYKIVYSDVQNEFSFLELSNTPSAPSQLMKIEFSDVAFKNYKYKKFMIHPLFEYPYKELEVSPVIDRSISSSNYLYYLTYFTLVKQRLPPPFVTNCLDYWTIDRQTQTDCHQRCAKVQSKETFGKIPFSSIESNQTSDDRVISYLDLMNKSVSNRLFELYEDCQSVCNRPDCHEEIVFTRVSEESHPTLAVKVNLPTEPSVSVHFYPILTFPAFLTYFLSCFGTWFGLSVVGLNPFIPLTGYIEAKYKSKQTNATQVKKDTPQQSSSDTVAFDIKSQIRFLQAKVTNLEKIASSCRRRQSLTPIDE